MIKHLRDVWQQLRWYPQGCNFEDSYRFLRDCEKAGGEV